MCLHKVLLKYLCSHTKISRESIFSRLFIMVSIHAMAIFCQSSLFLLVLTDNVKLFLGFFQIVIFLSKHFKILPFLGLYKLCPVVNFRTVRNFGEFRYHLLFLYSITFSVSCKVFSGCPETFPVCIKKINSQRKKEE